MRRIVRSIIPATLAIAILAACAPPKPPAEERRPEPQAQAAARPQSAIVHAADAYKDSARAAVANAEDAAAKEKAALDAATQ